MGEVYSINESCIKYTVVYDGSDSKVSGVYNSGATKDPSLIPGWVRFPGREHGNPLQYSCLEIPWTEEAGSLQFMESLKVRHN